MMMRMNKFAGLVMLTLCVYSAYVSAAILNNERLRFGNGSENSVNNSGNLQQPFYYSPVYSAWRKLTFSAYPLDFQLAEGGDGSVFWNLNGTFSTLNPALTGQTIDTSGFTAYNAGTNGYGTIISLGTVSVNGKDLEIRNTYELPQNSAYVKVTTRFRNTSGVAMSNLRYWVGTQDDWVGETDSPTKEKGNLIDGSFALIPTPATVSKALRIRTADEGVLFYTDTDKANIIVSHGYGWENVRTRNPVDSPIERTGDDGYAFYVRLNDLADGETDEIVWYYAAGPLEELEDIIKSVADAVSPGITPSSGSWTGGYEVVITGTNLSSGVLSNIEWVTLAGVTASVESVAGITQVVVRAGQALIPGVGDVVVQSTTVGTYVRPNAFTYTGSVMRVLDASGAVVASGSSVQLANGTEFGEAIVGLQMITNVFTITNAGNAVLEFNTVATNGAQASSFKLLYLPASLGTGSDAVFMVVFDPQVGGSNTASFVFSFDGPNSPYTLNVEGVGIGGGISLATDALSFAGTFAGANPSSQSLVMTNVGISGFSWTNAIAYSAGASNWLSVLPGSGTVPQAGATVLANAIDITGIAAGVHTALVAIVSADATNSPQAYAVSLSVGKALQVITFANPGTQIVTNETLITATASSGLEVSLDVVSGPAALSCTSPSVATYTAPGLVTLRATQGGDANWLAAAAVLQSYRVRPDRMPYADFDGDGRSDLSVFWPGGGLWTLLNSAANTVVERQWGWSEVVPVPADYMGDGQADIAVYHRAAGMWYIRRPNGRVRQRQFGWHATEAVPGDYNGDGVANLAVYHRASGTWHIINQDGTGYREIQFGFAQAVPVPGDYDGDGITDLAVYWPQQGRWFIRRSSDKRIIESEWGFAGTLPVPADYDGDGLTDLAVYWPQNATWYIRQSSDLVKRTVPFGWPRCVPVPGDFDGDGIDDLAVYEPNEGRWSILHSPERFTTEIFGWHEAQPPWPTRR